MIEFLDHFMIRALIAGLFLSALCGPMGSLVLWQRMGFLGDTLAHAALLGISVAAFFSISLYAGVLITTILIALALSQVRKKSSYGSSTWLAITTQATLAIGMIGLSLSPQKSNLTAFLFGDLLALSLFDLALLAIITPIVIGILIGVWNSLLKTILHEDIAAAEGVSVRRVHLIFILTLAISIAIASRLVGVLMITSLLIIPASAAKMISTTPEQMAFRAGLLSAVSVVGGWGVSWVMNLPPSPSITCVAVILLFGLFFIKKK